MLVDLILLGRNFQDFWSTHQQKLEKKHNNDIQQASNSKRKTQQRHTTKSASNFNFQKGENEREKNAPFLFVASTGLLHVQLFKPDLYWLVAWWSPKGWRKRSCCSWPSSRMRICCTKFMMTPVTLNPPHHNKFSHWCWYASFETTAIKFGVNHFGRSYLTAWFCGCWWSQLGWFTAPQAKNKFPRRFICLSFFLPSPVDAQVVE